MCEVIAIGLILRFDKKIILKTVYKQLPLIAQHKNTWKENTKYNSYTEYTNAAMGWKYCAPLCGCGTWSQARPGFMLLNVGSNTGSTTKGLKT